MNSLWDNMYDRVKDRRYGRLFLTVWFGVVLGLLLIAWASQEFFSEQPSRLSEGAAAIGLVLLFVPALRAGVDLFQNRRRPGTGENCSRLSSDELIKARSKLRSGLKVVKPPAAQAPDIDLKF